MAGRKTSSDAQLSALFLDMLAAEQGAGENTTDAYRRDLEDLSGFLARKGSAFMRATTDDVRGYLADLDRRGFKASSVARKLSALRSCPVRSAGAPCRRCCRSPTWTGCCRRRRTTRHCRA
jgi:integrase/recombinase XerD